MSLSESQRADFDLAADPLVDYALRSLVDRHRLDPNQAFEYLERLSRHRGQSVRRVCLDYLATADSELY